jgi:transposase
VISGLDSDILHGPPWHNTCPSFPVSPRAKVSDFYLHMHKMVFCFHVSSVVRPMLPFLRTSSNNFFIIVVNSQSPSPFLIMDNASFHHTDRVDQLCSEAGVKIMYLPPYSPDLNPIEEMFAELKGFIKRNWYIYEDNPEQGFDTFLE